MMTYSNELNEGYFVRLAILNLHLRHLSYDAHQYAALPVPGIFRSRGADPLSLVLLAYSNPESGGVLGNDSSFLNALCFVLPLVALVGERRTEPELIAAFSSKMMTALTRGLYIENGEVKYDLLEDFDRV